MMANVEKTKGYFGLLRENKLRGECVSETEKSVYSISLIESVFSFFYGHMYFFCVKTTKVPIYL